MSSTNCNVCGGQVSAEVLHLFCQ